MSAPLDLITNLAEQGVRVTLDRDELSVRGPADVLSPDVTRALRENRDELVALLGDSDALAKQTRQDAMDATATQWCAFKARHGFAPGLPDHEDERLQDTVSDALKARDLPAAMNAISEWRQTWQELLSTADTGLEHGQNRGWLEIDSDTLGERVIVALTDDAISAAEQARPDLVVYSQREVELLHAQPRLLRQAHRFKKAFHATVEEASGQLERSSS